jgi:hypothetical protein
MAKKVKTKTTRVSANMKHIEYKNRATAFIQSMRHPERSGIFSVKAYEVLNGAKKPSFMSVPELLAIVGIAAKLGKKVEVTVSQVGDAATVNFDFVAGTPSLPLELW